MTAIPKSPRSEELLTQLLVLPTDLSAIESLLREKNYTSDEISRAGYDYAESCRYEVLDYKDNHFEEFWYSESKVIPGLISTNMLQVFELLLKYGLDPNAVCDGETVIGCTANVYNGYVAADTLALLMEHGGDPHISVDGESLFDQIDFAVMFDAFEQGNRKFYDATVHCWFVLLGYSDNQRQGKELVTVFSGRRSECNLDDFKLSDLKNHRNYTFAITNVPGRGENWSLHIIDKRTFWEVARL